MEKFVPYEKMSKKQKEALNKSRRKDWGNINPATKRVSAKTIYNRKKARKDFDNSCGNYFFGYSASP